MSPNLEPALKTESAAEIEIDLEGRYESTPMADKTSYKFEPLQDDNDAIAVYESPDREMKQRLITQVKAGRTFFGIVSIETSFVINDGEPPTKFEAVAVTRHTLGKKAELVGLLDDNNDTGAVSIGRLSSGEIDPTVSSRHFSVAIESDKDKAIGDRAIYVINEKPTNGTTAYTPKAFNNDECIQVEGKDHLADPSFWSADSAIIESHLLDLLGRTIVIDKP